MKSEFQKLIENTSEKYLKDMEKRFQDDQRKASQKLAMVKKELKKRKKHDSRLQTAH